MSTKNLLSLVSVGALAGSASAGVMATPPYSGPGSTYQCWDFLTPASPSAADPGYDNAFGVPMFLASGGASWQPTQLGKTGVWTINPSAAGTGDFLNFRVPNMPDTTHGKLIWLEVKYFGGFPGSSFLAPLVSGDGFGPPLEPINFFSRTTRTAPNNPDWSIDTWIGSLNQCPLTESITLVADPAASSPTIVDWVCINTLCVPTPGAGALLTASVMALGIPRRRRA